MNAEPGKKPLMTQQPVTVPDDADESWDPPDYTPGPDDPGPVESVHDHGESKNIEQDQ